jgi:hypothetical protein
LGRPFAEGGCSDWLVTLEVYRKFFTLAKCHSSKRTKKEGNRV